MFKTKTKLKSIASGPASAPKFGLQFSFVCQDSTGYVDVDDFVQWKGKEYLVRDVDKVVRYALEKERQRLLGIDNVRFYDNPRYIDRFTVVFMDIPEKDNFYYALAMSEKPFHPQGFGQHVSAQLGFHLGRRIWFSDLNEDCQKMVMREVCPV